MLLEKIVQMKCAFFLGGGGVVDGKRNTPNIECAEQASWNNVAIAYRLPDSPAFLMAYVPNSLSIDTGAPPFLLCCLLSPKQALPDYNEQ